MNRRSDCWSPAAWAVAVWFGLGCVANAEAGWTIRHFEIVQGEPGSIVDSLIEGLGLGGVDADVIETLETYLGEVAIEYERLGFRQPRIDDTIQGGFAYKIFVYDYADGLPPAAYSVSRRLALPGTACGAPNLRG